MVHRILGQMRTTVIGVAGLGLAAIAGLLVLGSGCSSKSDSSAATAEPPPPEVVVVKVITKDVPDYRYYPGITQAILEANIVARVEGFLEERNFVEGTDVLMNQRLYLIQQDEYEATLASAAASLIEAKANLAFQRFNRDETSRAFNQGAATEYELDQAQAQFEEAQGQVASAQADIEKAELNLSYTDVVAPFAGRVGDTQVNVGNLVGPNMNTTLTTLVMLDPMRVIFEPAGHELTDFFSAQEEGEIAVQVTVAGMNGKTTEYHGVLDLINNQVTQQTSTFLARAVFPNTKKQVLPGMFVNLRAKLRMLPNTMVVPQDAVRSEPRDQYVYIVNSDDNVERQIVSAGATYEGFRIINSGLKVGDQVVVSGDPTKIRAGVKVTTRVEEANQFVTETNKKGLQAATASGGADTTPATEAQQNSGSQGSSDSGAHNATNSETGKQDGKNSGNDSDAKSSGRGAGSS